MKPEIRWNLVRRIRQQIARGTYVTEERLRVTVDRMLREEEDRAQDHRDVRVRGNRRGS